MPASSASRLRRALRGERRLDALLVARSAWRLPRNCSRDEILQRVPPVLRQHGVEGAHAPAASMPCGQSALCANVGEAAISTSAATRRGIGGARSPAPAWRRSDQPSSTQRGGSAASTACCCDLEMPRAPDHQGLWPWPGRSMAQVSYCCADLRAADRIHGQVHAPAMQHHQRQSARVALPAVPACRVDKQRVAAAAFMPRLAAGSTSASASSSASMSSLAMPGGQRDAQPFGAGRHGGVTDGADPEAALPSSRLACQAMRRAGHGTGWIGVVEALSGMPRAAAPARKRAMC